jgi:hypothetical protein
MTAESASRATIEERINLMSLSLGPLRSGSLSDDAETCVASKMGWNVAPFIADTIAVNLLELCGARDLDQ